MLWLALMIGPAMLLMFCALGQWRFPLDAAIVAALLTWLRGRVGPWLLWTLYYAVTGLFILHCFNIDLTGLSFYAEFAGSIPPPKPELQAAAAVCLLIPLLGTFAMQQARTHRRAVMALALATVIGGSLLRAIPASPSALQYALPVPSLTLARSYLAGIHSGDPITVRGAGPVIPGPMGAALLDTPLPDQLYIHTIESWSDSPEGLASLTKLVRSRFGDRLKQVASGYRPSYGATLQGELRELCYMERPVQRLSDVDFPACLPNRLKAMGYDTVAGHGYQSMFYLRSALYPRMGFAQTFFLDDLKDQVPVCAGVFPGLCDLNLLERLLQATSPHRKRLVYLMSLQSHEPISNEVLAQYGIQSADVNSTAVAHAFVAGALERLAAADGAQCGALLYFVGDHPPPSSKGSGAARELVSYLMLSLASTPLCDKR
ncbi:sulfatase-like hydrolase/transferase [Roseateles sp. P5_E7]